MRKKSRTEAGAGDEETVSHIEPQRQTTQLKRSLVVGVHNGLKLLPHSLSNIQQLPVEEAIFVLDNCNPLQEYKHIIKHYAPEAAVYVKPYRRWKYRPAETFRYGLDKASGDLLYVSAEDIVLDPDNFSLQHWQDLNVGMVDFRYYQRNPDKLSFHVAWDTMLLHVSDLFGYGTARSGIFGVRRSVYEEVGGIVDSPTEEDWLRKAVVKAGYRHIHVKSTHNLHLRPSYDKARQLMQGESRRRQGFTFKRTLAHSILHFKPYVLWGYLKCSDTHLTQLEA